MTQEQLRNYSDTICIICREEMSIPEGTTNNDSGGQIKRLPCDHIFHKSCLRSWFQRQQTCPTCRTSILRYHPHAGQQPGGNQQPAQPQQPQAQPEPQVPGFAQPQNNQQPPRNQPSGSAPNSESSASNPASGSNVFTNRFPSQLPPPPPAFIHAGSNQFFPPPFGNYNQQ